MVDLEDPSGLIFEAVALNVSVGGMCMLFPMTPTVGSRYGVVLELPKLSSPVVNEIEVRWTDPVRAKICGVVFLKGLRAIEVYTLNELMAVAPR